MNRALVERAVAVLRRDVAPSVSNNSALASPNTDGEQHEHDDGDLVIASTPELDRAALAGPIGELIELIEPHTEAHPAGLLFGMLAAVGALIGRSPYQTLDGSRHGCNIFPVLVGPTSDGRKGTVTRWARRTLHELDPDFERHNIAGGLSTGEGLIYRVRDPKPPAEGDKSGDAGVLDKRVLVVADELGGAFRKMSGRENILGQILRESWDGATLRTLTRRDALTATDPHITLLGSITPEELRTVSTDADFAGGTLNRFMLCWVERTRSLPHGGDPDPEAFDRAVCRLRRHIQTSRQVGRVYLDADACAWWSAEYEGLTAGRPGRLGQATRRAAPYVRRLAMIYALTCGRGTINAADLDCALAAWRYAADSAAFIFGTTGLSDIERRLVDALQHAGPDGLSRATIRETVIRSNSVPASKIAAALSRLRDAGILRSRQRATAGRSAEVWVTARHALSCAGSEGKKGSEGRVANAPGLVCSLSSLSSLPSDSTRIDATDNAIRVVI